MMSILLVRSEIVVHDTVVAPLGEHRLPALANDVIPPAQLVLQRDPQALAHAVYVPLADRTANNVVFVRSETAHFQIRLLDGVPLILTVVVAAVDQARHRVPADTHLTLHIARVLLDEDV